jgi:hypothetical protein
MIKSQDIQKITDLKVENIYGARSLAAINAAKFGTSIKVSEDGDISIYRTVLYQDNGWFVKKIMKVLSI